MDTLSISWTRAQADGRIARHRRVFLLALVLQIVVGALFLFFPTVMIKPNQKRFLRSIRGSAPLRASK